MLKLTERSPLILTRFAEEFGQLGGNYSCYYSQLDPSLLVTHLDTDQVPLARPRLQNNISNVYANFWKLPTYCRKGRPCCSPRWCPAPGSPSPWCTSSSPLSTSTPAPPRRQKPSSRQNPSCRDRSRQPGEETTYQPTGAGRHLSCEISSICGTVSSVSVL